MAYPQDVGEFILDCDACDVSIGCVLSQVQDNKERVIAYGSRTLNKAERNYCVTDKELLAVKHFIECYKHHLLGRRFRVRSDHQALKWLFSLKEPKSRVARWIEILSAYDFEVEYRRGTQHGNADALSRCPDPKVCKCPDQEGLRCGPCLKCIRKTELMLGRIVERETYVVSSLAEGGTKEASSEGGPMLRRSTRTTPGWLLSHSKSMLLSRQEGDSDISPVLQWKKDGQRPGSSVVCKTSPATRNYWQYWDSLEIVEGLLMRRFTKKDNTGSFLQFVVPISLRDEILHQMHDTVMSGHLGRKKTLAKAKKSFYWFKMKEDVNLWCEKCDVCAATKTPAKAIRAPLGKMSVGAPWD